MKQKRLQPKPVRHYILQGYVPVNQDHAKEHLSNPPLLHQPGHVSSTKKHRSCELVLQGFLSVSELLVSEHHFHT